MDTGGSDNWGNCLEYMISSYLSHQSSRGWLYYDEHSFDLHVRIYYAEMARRKECQTHFL